MSEQRTTRKQPSKGVKKGRPDLKEPTEETLPSSYRKAYEEAFGIKSPKIQDIKEVKVSEYADTNKNELETLIGEKVLRISVEENRIEIYFTDKILVVFGTYEPPSFLLNDALVGIRVSIICEERKKQALS